LVFPAIVGGAALGTILAKHAIQYNWADWFRKSIIEPTKNLPGFNILYNTGTAIREGLNTIATIPKTAETLAVETKETMNTIREKIREIGQGTRDFIKKPELPAPKEVTKAVETITKPSTLITESLTKALPQIPEIKAPQIKVEVPKMTAPLPQIMPIPVTLPSVQTFEIPKAEGKELPLLPLALILVGGLMVMKK